MHPAQRKYLQDVRAREIRACAILDAIAGENRQSDYEGWEYWRYVCDRATYLERALITESKSPLRILCYVGIHKWACTSSHAYGGSDVCVRCGETFSERCG